MTSRTKSTLALVLSLLMVISTVGLALAAPPPWAGGPPPWAGPFQNSRAMSVMRGPFQDMQGSEWAEPYAMKAFAMGLMRGRGPGLFVPAAFLPRIELLTLGARIADPGADTKAKSLNEVYAAGNGDFADDVGFADAEMVPEWARGYVALAVDYGLWEKEGDLNPLAFANRLEAVKVIIRALEYRDLVTADDLEEALQNVELHFRDLVGLTQEEEAYICLAYQLGIVKGYGGQIPLFRPWGTLIRAHMAAMVSRVVDVLDLDDLISDRETLITGLLTDTDLEEAVISLEKEGEIRTFPLAEEVYVTLNNVSAQLGDLREGDSIRAHLNDEGKVYTILASFQELVKTGTIMDLEYGDEGEPVFIKVDIPGEAEVEFEVFASYFSVKIKGEEAAFSDLKAGDLIEVKLHKEQVFAIVLVEEAEE